MSTDDTGRFGSPVPAATAAAPGRTPWRHWWADAARAALLAVGNFAALTLGVLWLVARFQHDHDDVGRNVNFFLGSDLATPLIAWAWFLILANGLVLCARQQTRAAGFGLMLAAGVIAIPVVMWVLWAFATFASG